MASRDGQSTDTENSRAPLKVGKPGDDCKVVNLKSVQSVAGEFYRDSPVVGVGTGADIIAPEQQ